MEKDKPIIVAQIMGKWIGGGVEAVVMNYYRHIDRTKIQFDFICDEDSTNIPYDEIEKLGGRVIIVPPYQHIFAYLKKLKQIFKENKYKIVHSHINALSVFPLYAAKCAGVPVRIAHSHSTSNKKEWKKTLMKNMLRPFSKVFATDYMCCSELAGRWLFGNKTYDEGKVYLLNNAIDVEKFAYNEEVRKAKRKELEIADDTFVIGHIGRFVAQKNHTFLIDIFNEVHKEKENSVLLLVGQGPLENEIKEKVNRLGLSDSVKFLGQRDDVSELYQAFDLFLLPSLYEGLGMVLIEAQCAGLPCVASTEVPNVAKISELLNFLDLKSSIAVWTEQIIKDSNYERCCTKKCAIDNGYSIDKEKENLMNYYYEKTIEEVAIVTSGFLPVPATKGGAVENLIVNILNENETNKRLKITIFSVFEKNAVEDSKKYNMSNFIFFKTPYFIRILDKITYFIAKNIIRKKNCQSYRYIFQRLYYLRNVSRNLKKNDYDKVLLENHPSQYLSLKWNKNYKKYANRYYYHCHNEFPGTYGCDEIIKGTRKIICVSNFIAKSLEKYLNMSEDKFDVLRNCVDSKLFKRSVTDDEKKEIRSNYGIKDNEFVLLFTGRLTAEKGVKELISAMQLIKNENVKLLIVGSSVNALKVKTTFEQELEQMIENIKEKVIFTGFVNYDEIYKMYAIADIAVLPSIWDDPAPLTIIEALVSGLPIITTRSGGIPEYATDGSAIILERDNNLVNNIAKSIETLISDKEEREKMSYIEKEVSSSLTLQSYYDNFIKMFE